MVKNLKVKVAMETLSDRSIVWNVKYVDRNLNLTIGCVDRSAAELLTKCLNEAAWISADVLV